MAIDQEIDSFSMEIAARTVWMEARGEGAEGQLAVACVIWNRWKSGKWFGGHTLSEVCLRPQQFSCWNTTDGNRQMMARLPFDEGSLQQCRDVVFQAITQGTDPTHGATHYHAVFMRPPVWTSGAQFVCQIGHHRFYKGVA